MLVTITAFSKTCTELRFIVLFGREFQSTIVRRRDDRSISNPNGMNPCSLGQFIGM